jgi:hypothetical protein
VIHDLRSGSIQHRGNRRGVADVDAAIGSVAAGDVVAHGAEMLDEVAADEAVHAGHEHAHCIGS